MFGAYMNTDLISSGARAGRSYSVDTATSNARYQSYSQFLDGHSQNPANSGQAVRFAAIDEDALDSEINDRSQNQSYLEGNDDELEEGLLRRYDCQRDDVAAFETQAKVITLNQTGSQVVMKRVLRTSLQAASDIEREINVLCTVTDPSIPLLIESLELKDVIWAVKEYRSLQTVAELVSKHGPISEEVLKTALNQLFSGIAALFMAGFAHLRICDQTVCFDNDRQLVITDFRYACEYGKDKDGDLYAPTQEKCGDDIYVAPEVFAHHTYNARKAVMWSCGVLLYFMTTGQTEKLSNLAHPSFDTGIQGQDPESYAPQPQAPTHRRYSAAAVQQKIILYPNSRFTVPNYARMIIPKMLVSEPTRRAELIEIASRVPKDYTEKATRPLMELAWLDYKTHVGPLAGLNLGDPINESSASSIFSMASNMSNPFRSLLAKGKGHSRRQSAPVVAGSGYGGGSGSVRW